MVCSQGIFTEFCCIVLSTRDYPIVEGLSRQHWKPWWWWEVTKNIFWKTPGSLAFYNRGSERSWSLITQYQTIPDPRSSNKYLELVTSKHISFIIIHINICPVHVKIVIDVFVIWYWDCKLIQYNNWCLKRMAISANRDVLCRDMRLSTCKYRFCMVHWIQVVVMQCIVSRDQWMFA